MTWLPFVGVLVAAIGYMAMKRSGQISPKEAAECLKNGAMVIDVRSTNEFDSGHIIHAQNLPLDRIEMSALSVIRDRNKVLLLHCSTGARSNLAKKKLMNMGFKNTFNLGSYDRAAKIITNQ
jgi:rhodanese-related sulfurtransferase